MDRPHDASGAEPTFRARLADAKDWTPTLRVYATAYVMDHTTQPQAIALQAIADFPKEDWRRVKLDIVWALVHRLTPLELLVVWDAFDRNRQRIDAVPDGWRRFVD